jgi:hypothetical protein
MKSSNKKNIPKEFVDKIKNDILCLNISVLKIVWFKRKCGKCGRSIHRTHDNITQHMSFACTQSKYNLLLLHINNCYTTVQLSHGCEYTTCLVSR